MIGVIKSIPSKDGKQANYAFIKGDDGEDYFLHITNLIDKWDNLKATVAVKREALLEFDVEKGLKGPRAIRARIVNV